MASASNLPHGENTLDDLFECFIETLHSTHTAIAFDTDAKQKLEFKSIYCYCTHNNSGNWSWLHTRRSRFHLWQHR